MKATTSLLPAATAFALLLLLPAPPAALAAKSTRPGMGAIPYADAKGTGTTFRVWAGSATKVEVAGDFNSWYRTELSPEGNGIWSVDVEGARHGQEYKFILNGDNWHQDPRAVRVASSDTSANCYIYDHSLFDWEGAEHVIGGTAESDCIWRNDLVIYEMHVGSFNAETYLPGTFDSAIDKIPHLKRLGVSAVELMPIAEFAGDRSWGYNPADLFAPESSFGGADGLKRFVRACHKAGIAVIVDVVHNHYGPSDLSIWKFDGTGDHGGMYFYNDDRRYTDWGETRPNYGDTNVVAFIRDQIFSLVEDYHIDGFRWDSVFNIAYTGNGSSWNPEGVAMLASVNYELARKHPDVFRIAEDHAGDAQMYFEAQWHHDVLTFLRSLAISPSDADRNMYGVSFCLTNGTLTQILYAESHDTCGDLNDKHRLPREIDGGSPQGYWAKKRAFLANAVALVAPGIPMLFMGSEYNEDWDFSNDNSLRWGATAAPNDGLVSLYSDLIALRRNFRGVTSGLRDMYPAWTTVLNNDGKVVAAARGENSDLLVVFNWSASTYAPYETMVFPSSGTWHCLFNSDRKAYDPSFGDIGPSVNDTVSVPDSRVAPVTIGPYTLQIWGKQHLPTDAAVAFDPPVPQGCSSVRILFDPQDGALAGASAVTACVAANDWAEPHVQTVGMTLADAATAADWAASRRAAGAPAPSGVLWECTVDIPDDTSNLHVCFNDGGDVWENNSGNNWTCAIADCGGMPPAVTTDPAAPTDGSPLVLYYEVNAGPLTNAAAIQAHIGFNGWSNIVDLAMANVSGDLWSCTVDVPLDVWTLYLCFNDGGSTWDNNNGSDYRISVSIADDTPVPAFAILSPDPAAPPAVVTDTSAQTTVTGTATNFAGGILWTNPASGASATIPLPDGAWTAGPIPLASGTNPLFFAALNPNNGAADSDYSAFADGVNGGHGFRPWIVNLPASNGGVFPGGSDGWGFWANNGSLVEAYRPFVHPLQPGDTLTFGFRNGYVDPGASVGFALCNSRGQRALQWYFTGGGDDYTLSAAARHVGTPFTREVQRVAFTLGSNWTYTLAVGTNTWTGNLKITSVDRLASIRFWNYNAGSNDTHNLYATDLAIHSSNPLLDPALTATVPVIYSPSTIHYATTSATVTTDPDTGAPVLTATLDADAIPALATSVWYAVTLDSNTHSWNWTNLPPSNITLSGPTVTIRCTNLPTAIYSIGNPP